MSCYVVFVWCGVVWCGVMLFSARCRQFSPNRASLFVLNIMPTTTSRVLERDPPNGQTPNRIESNRIENPQTKQQDKKISRSQRRLEEGGQGAMAMDIGSLRKNEEIMKIEVQVSWGA